MLPSTVLRPNIEELIQFLRNQGLKQHIWEIANIPKLVETMIQMLGVLEWNQVLINIGFIVHNLNTREYIEVL